MVETTVSGYVKDRQGIPLSEVDVSLQLDSHGPDIGRTITNQKGYFNISGKYYSNRKPFIVAAKEGYARSSIGGISENVVDYQIRLDREIDNSFLTELINETDPDQRHNLLMEIVGDRQRFVDVKDIFPYLGALRPDLIRFIESAQSRVEYNKLSTNAERARYHRKHINKPSERARYFLEYWHDPADRHHFITPSPPVNISGNTFEQVCDQWTDYHFTKPITKYRFSVKFGDPIFSPEKKHALITLTVYYDRLVYSYDLVLIHNNLNWNLAYGIPTKISRIQVIKQFPHYPQ